jgi:hypothetical protein
MKNVLFIIGLIFVLAGCAGNGVRPDSGRIDVQVTSSKIEIAEIDKEILNKCEKPKLLSKKIYGIKDGRVMEKDVIAALVESYTNEANCYLVKEEVLKLQERIREAVEKANGDGNARK